MLSRNEGAWINLASGEFAFIDEHANWIKQPHNAARIGLDPAVWKVISVIPNDYSGKNRAKILRMVMDAGFVRMRRHGDIIVFEFAADTRQVLWACRSVLGQLAGALTTCRFNNLLNEAIIELPYADYADAIGRDLGSILRLAKPLPRQEV